MRGISLDEIADATKIGTRLLRALEEEQFDLLPGGIFNKGFVRAYAKYLGMDEEQAVADYLHAAGDGEPDVLLIAQQNDRVENKYSDSGSSKRAGFPIIPVLILILVVGAGFGAWRLYQQRVAGHKRALSAESAPADSTPVPAVGSVPAEGGSASLSQTSNASPGTSASAPPANDHALNTTSGSETRAGSFEVVVSTTGPAWLSIKADGKIETRGILATGQSRTIRANDEVVVWTGNAGVTHVSFDGRPISVEGGANDVKVLVFRPNGLQPERKPQGATENPAQHAAEPPRQ